ncbi:rod shape-determining protein [candidate division WWE3 bacterium]|uniref:Cell shape-determining protein MreB n=1 Tax=candidate division WWE3 bacterium TaxID=2053526 RepID=A0A955LKG0_UNCKA|nr:rod shape-determining protein [candidate division WWE3 bacterium]
MAKINSFSDYIWRYITYDVGIDLGTANTLVYVLGKGIVIREPSTVAIHKKTKDVLTVGTEAKKMIGKTPANIVALRPLRDGVISDFDATESMLRYFIKKIHRRMSLFNPRVPRPRVTIGIPSGITEVERKAVIDAAVRSGARKVFLIEEPMAAAIGAGLPVEEALGSMVVDIGGGTSEMAVISLGGIVVSRSLRIAGDEFDEAIIDWAKQKHNLLIGERTAEEIKLAIGCALPAEGEPNIAMLRGRDLKTGLPKQIEVTENDMCEALNQPIKVIIENVKDTIEETPPEIISDLYANGITLTGGGALLNRLDQRIAKITMMPVKVDPDPLTTVVRGCGKTLETIDLLEKVQILQG